MTQDIRSAANDWDIALASLADGGWLTDTVLVQYFQSLAQRSLTSGTAYKFYSLHVLNRLYDDKGKTIRSHLQVHDGTLLTPAARDELDTIRAMHGYDEIFACARAYLPVALTNHYCLLEVDNINRTIAYMDTLYAGRSVGQVARTFADYLQQYEQELTGCKPSPWKIVYSQHMIISRASDMRSIPRQLNGSDCGVYVCAMADCLERGVDIMNITPGCIAMARVTLRQSLTEKTAHELITLSSACNRHMAVSHLSPLTMVTRSCLHHETLRRTTYTLVP